MLRSGSTTEASKMANRLRDDGGERNSRTRVGNRIAKMFNGRGERRATLIVLRSHDGFEAVCTRKGDGFDRGWRRRDQGGNFAVFIKSLVHRNSPGYQPSRASREMTLVRTGSISKHRSCGRSRGSGSIVQVSSAHFIERGTCLYHQMNRSMLIDDETRRDAERPTCVLKRTAGSQIFPIFTSSTSLSSALKTPMKAILQSSLTSAP